MSFLKKSVCVVLSLALVGALGGAVYSLNKAFSIGPPEPTQADTAPVTPVVANPAAEVGQVVDTAKPAVIAEPAKTVTQKIDATSDKAMVDSLDYISRQLDDAGQQQLQDDYSVIASVLTSQAIEDSQKDDDSLVKVRAAVNGKTAAELSDIADKLRPKN